MRGKGKSVGHPQSRTCSGRMKLKRCKNNGEADNVVLIDVDSDNLNNVIIIDVPESLKRKLRGSSVPKKDKKCQLRTIIYIDDDENSDSNHPGQGVEGGDEFYNDASSSGDFCWASNHTRNTLDAVGDECQFVEENLSPLRLSKCKRTYSGKTSCRNRYGLGPKSDGDSSDYDCPDHEFMEDSFGKLREQWEKANTKKNIDVRNGQSVRPDQATTSGSHTGTQQKVEVENRTDQYTETQTSPSSRNARYQEKPSPFVQAADGNLASTSNNSKKTPADFGLKTTQENNCSNNKDNYWDRGESVPVDPALNNNEGKTNNNLDHGSSGFLNEEYHCSPESSSHKRGNKQVKHAKKTFQEKEKTMPAESCIPNAEPTVDIDFGCTEASLSDEAVPFFRTQHSVEIEDDHGREKLRKASSCKSCFPNESEDTNRSVDKEKLVYGEPMQNIKPSNEVLVNGSVADNEVGAVQKKTFCEGPPLGKSGIEKERGCCRGILKPVPEEPSLCSFFHNGIHTDQYLRVREYASEFLPNNQQEKDGPLHDQELSHAQVRDTNAVQGSIINEREKLKETDEYKRAVEEEWASRQREIQLQAEEAQKLRLLRKRKKAESMRLLDMERRQKQRVEEMREIQKKDEENMNLKELLRAEIREELNELEITCRDMASLLRGLGIQVGSGFQPLPHEVRAAYKRALLSFHPDRASGSDIRQLVEAEEKFKLISRMKDKF